MRKNIFITGLPGVGKSTLLAKVLENQSKKTGLMTREMLDDSQRIGFRMGPYSESTAEKDHGNIIACTHFVTPEKVSKYHVDVRVVDDLAERQLCRPVAQDELVYLDEIGQMQLFSEKFKMLVLGYLNSENISLMTLSAVYEDAFTALVRERDDIIIVQLTKENRESREKFLTQLIGKIQKAKKYITEPVRFKSLDGNRMEIKSDHGHRIVDLNDNSCQCDFFKDHSICSHVLATEEIMATWPLM